MVGGRPGLEGACGSTPHTNEHTQGTLVLVALVIAGLRVEQDPPGLARSVMAKAASAARRLRHAH